MKWAIVFTNGALWQQILLSLGGLICIALLVYIIINPFIAKTKKHISIKIHPETQYY